MKIVVTGASGFVGRYFIAEIVKNGSEIIAINRAGRRRKILPDTNVLTIEMDQHSNLEALIKNATAWFIWRGMEYVVRQDRMSRYKRLTLSPELW